MWKAPRLGRRSHTVHPVKNGKTNPCIQPNSVPFVDPRLSDLMKCSGIWRRYRLNMERGNAVELGNQKGPQNCIEVLIQQGIGRVHLPMNDLSGKIKLAVCGPIVATITFSQLMSRVHGPNSRFENTDAGCCNPNAPGFKNTDSGCCNPNASDWISSRGYWTQLIS